MTLEEIGDIASKLFKEQFDKSKLSKEEREMITLGSFPSKKVIDCTFYIPGEKPQDAVVLAEYSFSKKDGSVIESKLYKVSQ